MVETTGIHLCMPFKVSSKKVLYDLAFKNYHTHRGMERVLGGIYGMLIKQTFILMTFKGKFIFFMKQELKALHMTYPQK